MWKANDGYSFSYILEVFHLILGNGGEKTTKTYEESEEFSGYVMDLQKFDALLEQEQKNGKIKIEQNVITGIESASFEL